MIFNEESLIIIDPCLVVSNNSFGRLLEMTSGEIRRCGPFEGTYYLFPSDDPCDDLHYYLQEDSDEPNRRYLGKLTTPTGYIGIFKFKNLKKAVPDLYYILEQHSESYISLPCYTGNTDWIESDEGDDFLYSESKNRESFFLFPK